MPAVAWTPALKDSLVKAFAHPRFEGIAPDHKHGGWWCSFRKPGNDRLAHVQKPTLREALDAGLELMEARDAR